jgi:putative ATP-dependent endonuclease of OLD family
MIEDVVGWILNADTAAALPAIAAVIARAPVSIAELIARLKSEDRAAGGLKQDQVAYEAVADVIGALEPCCRRARELLNGLSDVLLGGASPMFVEAPQGDPRVKIFRP